MVEFKDSFLITWKTKVGGFLSPAGKNMNGHIISSQCNTESTTKFYLVFKSLNGYISELLANDTPELSGHLDLE